MPNTPRIVLTLRCNRQCSYCALGPVSGVYRELSAAEWARRIEELPGTSAVFTGGEPSVHPEFAEIVRRSPKPVIAYSNFATSIRPNGFDPKKVSWRASCHATTRKDAEAFCERVRAFRAAGYTVRCYTVERPKGVLADVLQEQGIGVTADRKLEPLPPIEGPVICHLNRILVAPDGRRFHCVTKIARGDPTGAVRDDHPRVQVCEDATRCCACDMRTAKRVPTTYCRQWYEREYHKGAYRLHERTPEEVNAEWERKGYRARAEAVWDALPEPISGEVLEVACHHGKSAVWMLARFPDINTMHMFDFSTVAVEFCKRIRVDRDRMNIWQGDVRNIPLPDDYLDWINCTDVTEHLPEDVYQNMILELLRVLKPGGRLVLYQGTAALPEHIHILPPEKLLADFTGRGFRLVRHLPHRHILLEEPRVALG